MLDFTLGASPLSKLLLVQEFVLPYQTSELVQSLIPHHCQLLPLSCPSAESHFISIANLCLRILLLPNPPVYSSHLLLFLLLTLSVLLGFFSSASQGRCRGALQTLFIPQLPSSRFQEGRAQQLSLLPRASITPRGWRAAGNTLCPGWCGSHLFWPGLPPALPKFGWKKNCSSRDCSGG